MIFRAILWQRYSDNGISIFDRGDAVTIWNGRDYQTRQSRGAAGAWGQREQEEKQEEENKRGIRAPLCNRDQYDQGFQFSSCTFAFPAVLFCSLILEASQVLTG
jgi:hypothetical protein